MSQRFCLFYAGYAASAPSAYFSKMALFNELVPVESDGAGSEKFSGELHDMSYESSSSIRTAISIADHFKLEVLPEPAFAEDYLKWLKQYIGVFDEHFPITRIDHYYFFYAQKLAEMLAHSGVIITLCELAAAQSELVNILYETDKHLSEMDAAIFRTMAAAALLSSEPRHGYFRSFYNEITDGFLKFKTLAISELEPPDLIILKKDIEAFRYMLLDGLKKCIDTLKELGV